MNRPDHYYNNCSCGITDSKDRPQVQKEEKYT